MSTPYTITCQRGTKATYVRASDKTLRVAQINQARFESDGLMIESVSKNYFKDSEDPAKWGIDSSRATVSILSGWDGLKYVQIKPKVTEPDFVIIKDQSMGSMKTGDYVTLTMWLGTSATATTGINKVRFRLGTKTAFLVDNIIDVSKTNKASKPAETTFVTQNGNWRRITWTTRIPTVTGTQEIFASIRNNVGVTTLSYNLMGVQFEKGSIATSFIPTYGSVGTRDRDYFQIKDLPTKGNAFVYHFHYTGTNTEFGRLEMLAYANPLRRDDYRLVRLWKISSGNSAYISWKTRGAGPKNGTVSTAPLIVDLRGRDQADALNLFLNSASWVHVYDTDATVHAQLAIRGTVTIPGDDPDSEGYSYRIKHLYVYDRELNEADMDKIESATPPTNALLIAPLTENLNATRRGYKWVPKFNGTNSYATFDNWTPAATFDVDVDAHIDKLGSTMYLLDSRVAGTTYAYLINGNKLNTNTGGSWYVNGVPGNSFTIPSTGRYVFTGLNCTVKGVIFNRVGSRYNGSEYFNGKIYSIKLRDNQYDVDDVTGSKNKSRYYDLVKWTDTNTAPKDTVIYDSWNPGKNPLKLFNVTWVKA